MNDAEGHEQIGQRPAIVLAVHKEAKLCMVIPLTSNKDTLRFPYSLGIHRSSSNGLSSDSVALIYQMRSLTSSRFDKKIGIIEPNYLESIIVLVKNYFGIA